MTRAFPSAFLILSLAIFILISAGTGGLTHTAPTLADSNLNTPKATARTLSDYPYLNSWHHDCSNLTAFDGLGNKSWVRSPDIDVSFGSLTSSGVFINATDTGTGAQWHGPLLYHTLSNPIVFSAFTSFETTIQFDASSASCLGFVILSIHDETNKPIISLMVNDGWVGLDRADAGASWTFENGSRIDSPMSSGDTVQEPYYETISAFQNASGVYVDAPRIGEFKLLDSKDTNPLRTVKYVSIQIASHSTFSICETMRIHDIRLAWETQEPALWHDDCSSLTTFEGIGDNSWPHDSVVSVTFGSVSSSGTYFYCDDVGSGSGHHGPLLYHTLAQSFSLSQFAELQAEIEIDATSANRRGWIRIGLHAADNSSILTLQVADPWTGTSAAYANAIYKYENGTLTETPGSFPDYASNEPYHETFTVFYNSSGLYTSFPGIANSFLLNASQVENLREIKYVSIQFNGYGSGVLCETMRIHDIRLTWDSPIETWHHDCNDLIEFGGVGDGSWTYFPGDQVSIGSMDSTSGYIYASDYGTGSVAHGPMLYHTLDSSFYLGDLNTFEAELELNSTGDTPIGKVVVALHDDMNRTIAYFVVADDWSGQNDVTVYAAWYFSNGTLVHTPDSWPTYTPEQPYREVVGITQNLTGIFAKVPRVGEFKLVDGAFVEPDRVVAHVSILITAWSTSPPCDVLRVHDIVLNWNALTLDSPSDITYEAGTTNHELKWNPYSSNPDAFLILRNGTVVDSGTWNISGISWNVDGLLPGLYNYTLTVYDQLGNSAADTAIVTVANAAAPAIDHPSNLVYEAGTMGHVITWNPSDLSPSSYTILRNGTTLISDVWDGSSIGVSVDGLLLGPYNYTLVVYDQLGNQASRTVLVEVVDTITPILDNSIINSGFETGTFSPWVNVGSTAYNTIQAGVVFSGTYALFMDSHYGFDPVEQTLQETLTLSSNPRIHTAIYPEKVGPTAGQAGVSAIFLEIENAITHSTTEIYYIWSGYTYPDNDINANITWAAYNIFDWTPNQWNILNRSILDDYIAVLGVPIDPSDLVVTKVSLVAHNSNGDPGDFYADNVQPFSSPDDFIYEQGTSGNNITWYPFDLNPMSYTIHRNGSVLKSGAWNYSSEAITISVDGLSLGTHNYTLVAYDTSGNWVADTVIVTVTDTTPPSIDHPINLVCEVGTVGHQIVWHPTDTHPASYQILRNGSEVFSDTWYGSDCVYDVDGLPLGVYNYTLVVYDSSGNSAGDSVLVSVVDTTSPTINHPSDLIYEIGTTGHTIEWTPSDLYPGSYQILRNGVPIVSGSWDGSSISVSVDGLAGGTYNYTIIVADSSGNLVIDSVSVAVLGETTLTTTPTTWIRRTGGASFGPSST
ncbi:MAG: hypothetical protein ACXADD_16385 [Candidatus Thorarchaeota archaeon]